MDAGVGLLPDWAARMHGFDRGSRAIGTDIGVTMVRGVVGWALRADKGPQRSLT